MTNKCKWAQGDFEEICVNADCPMCADFCPVLTEPGVCRYEDRGKRTNADKIRSMTDEDLAKFLCNDSSVLCANCDKSEFCNSGQNGYLVWLKQEVEE